MKKGNFKSRFLPFTSSYSSQLSLYMAIKILKISFRCFCQKDKWDFFYFNYLWKKIGLGHFTMFQIYMKLIKSLIKVEESNKDGNPNTILLRGNFPMLLPSFNKKNSGSCS